MNAPRPRPAEITEHLQFQKDLVMLFRQGQPVPAPQHPDTPEARIEVLVRTSPRRQPRSTS
ncbi:MAG: hypothetical protein M9913_23590 [Bryobacteraceae bacterium]|nr:hypothetical protein [Solibacteraceae bacterium]MCO5353821.1 hypothetical protein [Bryobacteraceae bacterium]